MNHPGNTLFRNFLEAKFDAYANAKSKNEKTTIAWSIVFELKESYGSRFLREDGLWWYEVSNEVAREKVSVGFRDVRKSRSKSSIYSSSASNSNNIQATTEVAATTAAAAATTTKRKCDYETTAPMITAAAKGFRVFDNQVNNSTLAYAFLDLDDSGKRQRCQFGIGGGGGRSSKKRNKEWEQEVCSYWT